jgi:hypothetical protein
MRGTTIAELKAVITGLPDYLPIMVVRNNRHDPKYETPDDPEVVNCRFTLRGLVVEVEDGDIADLIKTAYDNEDAASKAEDLQAEADSLRAELDSAEKEIERLEAELAKLKEPVAA